MIATMNEHKGIGLAAPQVGVNQRILVADVGQGPFAMINPKIIKKSGSGIFEEGCLSIPGVTIKIKRAQKILAQYVDYDGRLVEKIFEDLMARVVLHETDHLDGKLIIDYASLALKRKLRKSLKDIEAAQKKAS